ncbi:hypothetical protein BP6252_11946 [Coleophoma cylindrospora]|uniref:Transcription factor domain-containing protein n=1 Tax=Coleophoma cylindrospora TaxID=1849047 RepID=A0A3D8QFG3_9HELO|nr:hypothetical protein BP6252_11946 [Coleophoma cylindrospora]
MSEAEDSCKASGKECHFVAPRPITRGVLSAPVDHTGPNEQLSRIDALERQVAELTRTSQEEFRQLKDAMANLSQGYTIQTSAQQPPSTNAIHSPEHFASHDRARAVISNSGSSPRFEGSSLLTKGILSEDQCLELFDFFHQNCNDTIAFFDSINVSTKTILQTPILLATICTIGARASRSSLYEICRLEAESLIQQTMVGPTPDLLSLRAVMIYATWHHANRIWGHAVNLGYELGLHTAALSLDNPAAVQNADTVERARTWLSLCVVDLINNLNAPFFISNIQRYTKLGTPLLSSKYFRTVDYRIAAYLELFGIAADAKESMSPEMIQASPLSDETKELFDSYNLKVDTLFHNVCNNVDPLYQTFSRPQDRNRMLIPYSFVRMYINGVSLHGLSPSRILVDPAHIQLVRTAIEAAKMMLRAALQSLNFQKSLSYSIDYSGAILILATNFLSKAVFVAHQYIDVPSIVHMFHRVLEIFRNSNAPAYVSSLEKTIVKVSEINGGAGPSTPITPGWSGNSQVPRTEGVLFDILGSTVEFVSDSVGLLSLLIFIGWQTEREL